MFLPVVSKEQDKGPFPLCWEVSKKVFQTSADLFCFQGILNASQVPGPGFRCSEVIHHVKKVLFLHAFKALYWKPYFKCGETWIDAFMLKIRKHIVVRLGSVTLFEFENHVLPPTVHLGE